MTTTSIPDSPEAAGPHRALVAGLRLIKLLVLPFRFAWLLIVWLRLRRPARK